LLLFFGFRGFGLGFVVVAVAVVAGSEGAVVVLGVFVLGSTVEGSAGALAVGSGSFGVSTVGAWDCGGNVACFFLLQPVKVSMSASETTTTFNEAAFIGAP
jgi:hypothetical protein